MSRGFKFPSDSTPFTIAHRGARSSAPENTLAAAEAGLAQGAFMWELDVCLSADGVPVVVHDDNLERTTDISSRPDFAHQSPWRVCDLTLDEIRSLDAGSWFTTTDPFGTIAAGEVNNQQLANYVGCQIPTLEEALYFTRAHDWRANIEIKDHARLKGHDSVTAIVVEMIRSLDMVDRVLLSTFQHRYLTEARTLLPQLARAVLVEGTRPADPLALCKEYAAAAYHPDYALVTAKDVTRLRAAGIHINVWTINNVARIRTLALMGVNGFITDYPARTQKVLGNIPPQAITDERHGTGF